MQIELIELLIVPAVPVLVSRAVKVLRGRPKWIIPVVLVPLAGVLLQAAMAATQNSEIDPLVGALLGAAGLFLREVADQGLKAADIGDTPRIEEGERG